jgi:hypothetical protein
MGALLSPGRTAITSRGMKRVRERTRLACGRGAEPYWLPHHLPGSGAWCSRKAPCGGWISMCLLAG